jgi:XRE family transcriptional regulator, aerobic/anaerobic benzoate catabolism transcriptional regulator
MPTLRSSGPSVVGNSHGLQTVPAHAGEERPALSDQAFLHGVGSRVRELRERRGMTRKAVAREADVSERYLGQLEAGEGNISIVLLRRVTQALSATLAEVLEPESASAERRLISRLLEKVPAHRVEDLIFRLVRDFGNDEEGRRKRVALIGLRGAGKTTLGQKLAAERGCDYVELDREIERESGLPLSELFSFYGQSGYRRLERRCLERLLDEKSEMVLAVGGGLVAESETFNVLLGSCYTVWLKTTPEEHMSRVLAQGDLRPMADNDTAMEDLKRILQAREPLYRMADAMVDTSSQTVATSLGALRKAVTN